VSMPTRPTFATMAGRSMPTFGGTSGGGLSQAIQAVPEVIEPAYKPNVYEQNTIVFKDGKVYSATPQMDVRDAGGDNGFESYIKDYDWAKAVEVNPQDDIRYSYQYSGGGGDNGDQSHTGYKTRPAWSFSDINSMTGKMPSAETVVNPLSVNFDKKKAFLDKYRDAMYGKVYTSGDVFSLDGAGRTIDPMNWSGNSYNDIGGVRQTWGDQNAQYTKQLLKQMYPRATQAQLDEAAIKTYMDPATGRKHFAGYSEEVNPVDLVELIGKNIGTLTPQQTAHLTKLRPQFEQRAGQLRDARNNEDDADDGLGIIGDIASIAAVIPGPWQVPAMVVSGIDAADKGNWASAVLNFAGAGGYGGDWMAGKVAPGLSGVPKNMLSGAISGGIRGIDSGNVLQGALRGGASAGITGGLSGMGVPGYAAGPLSQLVMNKGKVDPRSLLISGLSGYYGGQAKNQTINAPRQATVKGSK